MGTLSLVSFTLSTVTVNLDTINSGGPPDDWSQFDSSFTATNKRSGGGATLTATITGGGGPNTVGDGRTVSWSNGTPTASGSSTTAVYNSSFASGAGVIYTFPASTSVRTAWLVVGPYNTSTCRVQASLSDGSATAINDTTTMVGPGGTTNPGVLIFSYSANSAGQTLTITITNQAASPQTHLLEAIAVAVSGGGGGSVIYPPRLDRTGFPLKGPLSQNVFRPRVACVYFRTGQLLCDRG
jgi:hypothetical protein